MYDITNMIKIIKLKEKKDEISNKRERKFVTKYRNIKIELKNL